MKTIKFLIMFILLVLIIAACGDDQDTTDDDKATEGATLSPGWVITPENADQVTELVVLGKGLLQEMMLSADDRLLGIATSDGLWLLDVDTGSERLLTSGNVDAIAFSPDSQTIAGAIDSNVIALWDTSTRERTATVQTTNDEIEEIAFSPDGARLFVYHATSTGSVSVWATESGESVFEVEGIVETVEGQVVQTNTTYRLSTWAMGSDGQRIVVGFGDGTLQVIDVVTGEIVQNFEGITGEIVSVDYSPDGSTVLAGSRDGATRLIRLWDIETGEEIRRFEAENSGFDSIAFSPDGSKVLSAFLGRQSYSHMWDVATGELIGTYDIVAKFMPNSEAIYGGMRRSQPIILDIASGEVLQELDGEFDSLIVSSDGQTAFSSSNFGSVIYQLDIEREAIVRIVEGFQVATAYFTPDGGRLLYTAGFGESDNRDQRRLSLWDIGQGETVREFTDTDLSTVLVRSSTDISPNGRWLAGGSFEGIVRVWDMNTGDLRYRLDATDVGTAEFVAFSPDSSQLIGGRPGVAGNVIVWDVSSGEVINTLQGDSFQIYAVPHAEAVEVAIFEDDQALVWSNLAQDTVEIPYQGDPLMFWDTVYAIAPNGETVASPGTTPNSIRIWDVGSGETRQTLEIEQGYPARLLSFSFDSQFLAIPLQNRDEVAIFDVGSGDIVQTLAFTPNDLGHMAWSPVNYVIAMVNDSSVGLWDGQTGEELWAIDLAGGNGRAVEFSANGAYFTAKNSEFISDGRGVVHVFGLESE